MREIISRRLQPLTHPNALWAAAAAASLFWAYYFFQRKVVGPLNPDEIYFAHVFWLLKQSQEQYVDFFSTHLPFYFHMFEWSFSKDDLDFLWKIRVASALLVVGYFAALIPVLRAQRGLGSRSSLLVISPLILSFLTLGRMIEVRPDTFGLFLFNAAWAILLTGATRPKILAAAAVASASALFSARAPIMLVGLGLLCLYLVLARRDYIALLYLTLMGVAAVVAALIFYLSEPEWTWLVVRSVFIEPATILGRMTLWERIFQVDRAILAGCSLCAVLVGIALFRRGEKEYGAILSAACGCQLFLIFVDPAPYQYVYGWAAVPAVVGVARIGAAAATYAGLFSAAAFLIPAGAYVAAKGHEPPTGSGLRLGIDPIMGHRQIEAMSTQRLVTLMITEDGQQNLENQLRLRREICRRIDGKVMSNFAAHPICLPDSSYYWNELQWPPIVHGDSQVPGAVAISEPEFVRILTESPPSLLVWGRKFAPGRRLMPAVRAKLTCCYLLYDGYAIPAGELERRQEPLDVTP